MSASIEKLGGGERLGREGTSEATEDNDELICLTFLSWASSSEEEDLVGTA